MPQLVDPSTGQLHDVADADAAGAIAAGWHPQTVGESDVASTAAANELNFGGISGGVKAGLAGLARGATLGGSDVAARVLGGEDTAKTLAGLQAQNPITSGVSEFAGALAPAVISGGGATPAGVVSKLGQGVTRGLTREGAGLIERTAVHSAAAAAEGSLYGAGQYLSQVALEDKPISAEGFVGSMGRGALFAAPIGGGFSLAGEALLRARSLFPKSQITPEAAAAIKSDASAALHESVADADAMAQAARLKIAQADAQAGAAGARTQVTRAVFGGGDPAAIDAAAGASVNKEQLTAALSKLETSQVALKDWIAAGGEDELADLALSAKRPVTPEVPVGEFGAPGARGYKPGEVAAPGPPSQAPLENAAEGTPVTRMLRKGAPAVEDIGATPASVPTVEAGAAPPSLADIRPADEAPGTMVGRRKPALATTPFDFKDSGLTFDPATRQYTTAEAGAASKQPTSFQPTDRPAGGSQGGKWYRDEHGQQWFGKSYGGSTDRVEGEHVVNQIYRAFGIDAPETQIANVGGRPTLMSREVPGRAATSAEDLAATDAKDGFVVDAWLANHDVVGLAYDNMLVHDGKAIRVDNGGSTLWRARGEPKEFPGVVGEIESMREPRRPAGQVFGGLSKDEIQGQLKRFAEEYPKRRDEIAKIVDQSGLSATAKAKIKSGLDERAQWLIGQASPAREIASEKEFRDFQSALKLRLTDNEIEQSLRYSREYYMDVNRHLRGDARNAVLPESEEKIIPALDSMLDKSRTAEPIITHRGASIRRVGKLQPGDVYVDPAYGSTSWRSNSVNTFGDVHMIIESPTGTRIAPIPSSKSEGEFLLPRDTKYRITGRRDLSDGRVELHATVEDTAPPAGHEPLKLGPPAIDKPLEAMSKRELEYSLDKAADHQRSFQSAAERRSPEFEAAKNHYNEISERLRAVKAGAEPVEWSPPTPPVAPADDLLSQLQGTAAKLGEGKSIGEIGASSPSRAEYVSKKLAKREADAAYFRAKAKGAAPDDGGDLLSALQGTNEGLGAGKSMRELSGAPMVSDQVGARATSLEDIKPVAPEPKSPSDTTRLREMIGGLGGGSDLPVSAAEYSARREAMGFASATAKKNIGRAADNDAIEALLQKRTGKNVDMAPALERAAKVIGDHEAASAEVADLLGADAPKTAVEKSQALAAARQAHAEAQGASAAKAAQGINDRGISGLGDQTVVEPGIRERMDALRGRGDKTVVDPTIGAALREQGPVGATATAKAKGGIGGKLADVGTALEVMKALGVHVPALSAIPVIGPVLGLFLKARAVLGILGRKGGSVGRDVDGLIAAASAATRDRIAKATQAILTGAGKGALKISEAAAGPSVTLSYKLFPGDGITKSKDPQKLYEARMDEIARAQQPNAIDHAIADRYQTSDPALHDAIVGQVQRGISFLDSKAPKPSILQTMLPGDGVWKPSKAQLDEFGKYVHAVGDPASVLEDLAKGHVTLEGAETLRIVYPELFADAQRMLMQSAPKMQKTLPYPTRVAISILYRVPVDNSMAPGHLQYLQAPTPGAQPAAPTGGQSPGAPMPPAITGPLQLGQSTMTALDRRAGA